MGSYEKPFHTEKNVLGTEDFPTQGRSSRETFPYYLLMQQFSIYDKVTCGFNFKETLPYIFRNEKPFPNGIFVNIHLCKVYKSVEYCL